MDSTLLVNGALALLPALALLMTLLFVDSFKLVRPPFVLWMLCAGAIAAGIALVVNSAVLRTFDIEIALYARAIAPPIEEALKAALIVVLIRREHVGFVVDAAIAGFAIGAGFAIVENLQYLRLAEDAGLSTWLVRGFGTALMHGGATGFFAVIAVTVLERRPDAGWFAFVPAYAIAVALHATFNALSAEPLEATLAALIAVPLVLFVAFHFSDRTLRDWIGTGFDHDVEMLALLKGESASPTRTGAYLESIRRRLKPRVHDGTMRYLRLSCELSLRARGVLMLREGEMPVPPLDAATRSHIDELRVLEATIGRSGLRALRPLIGTRRKFLWQLRLLEATADDPG